MSHLYEFFSVYFCFTCRKEINTKTLVIKGGKWTAVSLRFLFMNRLSKPFCIRMLCISLYTPFLAWNNLPSLLLSLVIHFVYETYNCLFFCSPRFNGVSMTDTSSFWAIHFFLFVKLNLEFTHSKMDSLIF